MKARRAAIAAVTIGALVMPLAPANAYPAELNFIAFVHYLVFGGPDTTSTATGQERRLRAKIQLGESSEYPNVEAPWCIKQREVYVDRYNPTAQKWVNAGMDVTNKDGLAKVNMKDRTGRYRARLKVVEATDAKPIECWKVKKGLGRHRHN
jgi:hypothetical protein